VLNIEMTDGKESEANHNRNQPLGFQRETFNLIKDDNLENITDSLKKRIQANDIEIDKLLESGIVNLNKPMGPTSHQVSSWVKNIFNIQKVGHGGTLDPRVTGVLPLGLGSSARILNVLTYSLKKYVGVMRLHGDVPIKKVKQVFEKFTGPIYQLPPIRSAVKRQLRIRTIYSLEVIESKGRDVLFIVECQAGTYIRSLVNDLGIVLGSGGHMQELRRLQTGPFHERDSVTLQELKDALIFWQEEKDDNLLRKCIKPLEVLLMDLPKIMIHDSAVDAVCHGANLAIPGIIQFEDILHKGEPVGIFTRRGEGVAIGEASMTTKELLKLKSGYAVKTKRVIMPPGVYKKGWKTKESTG